MSLGTQLHGGERMRRRLTHTSYFTALFFILLLSFVHVPTATSQNSGEIIGKLRGLQEKVSVLPLDDAFENIHAAGGQRKALANKIGAVIHQIEAGACGGAVNKLENDLKGKVKLWITPEYQAELIEEIDEIISLIKGELPPPFPDFFIEVSPLSLTIAQGEFNVSTITITSLNGFSGLVDITVSGVPLSVTTTLDPAQVTPPPDGSDTSTLTVHVDLTAVLGSYILTVTGTSGTLEHSVDITLEITEPPPPPNFAISASSTSLIIQQGDSNSSNIVIASLNGFSAPVDLAVTSPPITGVTTILDPTQVTPPAGGSTTSILTVQVEDSATPEMYTLTVTGTSGSLLHSVDIELEITTAPPSPDFSIAVHPSSLLIQQGTSNTVNITVTSLNGFSDLVTLTVLPAIVGVTYSFDPSVVTPPADGTITSNLTIAVAETAIPNVHVLVLTGTSGILQHSANLSLEITTPPAPPDVEPPTARIDEPANGNYLAGVVNIVVFMHDKNFKRAELTINNTLIASWAPENVSTGEHSVSWDTTLPEYPDDSYNITLSAEDEAGNISNQTCTATVDNTKPTVTIDAPAEESYLRGSVLIYVTGVDKNFYKMNLEIDRVSVKNWTTGGSQIYEWNTGGDGIDGARTITLTVYDKAGNIDESSVTVIVDNTLPTLRIDEPVKGSYLAGLVDIKVFIQEENLDKAELTINGTEVVSWTLSGENVFNWDTTTYAEGVYFIELSALDKAGNIGEKIIKVTVDNTAPTALIHAPTEGSYLQDTVSINVRGDDTNFDRMELRIGDVLANTWNTSGDKPFPWKTKAYSDGVYKVTLTVCDKANSSEEVFVTVTVDNTSPIIEAPTWRPKEPSTDEWVTVTAKVSDPQPGSGVQNVTLWYRNTTMDDWQHVPMSLNVTSGNWTTTIPAQSMETTIEFYIEALDNVGNKAVTDEIYEYNVIAPAGIPLAWIAAIILLILAATATAIYLVIKWRRKKQGADSSRIEN